MVEAEWPQRMEVGLADSIRVSLVRVMGQTFVPTIEVRGHKASAATPIPVDAPGTPGIEYKAFAIAELAGTTFMVKPVMKKYQPLDQPEITWEWNVVSENPGPQVVNASIYVLWVPVESDAQAAPPYLLWRDRFDIVVAQPRIRTDYLYWFSFMGLVMGLALCMPVIASAIMGKQRKLPSPAPAPQLTYGLESTRESAMPIKILFLTANPSDNTARLRLDEECRAIDQALRQAEFRDRFDIRQHWAVRVTDLQGYLLRHKPHIVHFSGHGSPSSEIILEDSTGKSHPVSARALSALFAVLKDNVRCVVLNACYSEQQARAIAGHIDCVIGMSQAIGDKAAIAFAAAFYQALGYGRDVKTAFDLGCVQIDLERLGEQDTPKLVAVKCNPEGIVFVQGG